MFGYWHHHVVRLSVCLWRCALWLSWLVYRAKLCTSVFLAGKFLFVRWDVLLWDVSFSHKTYRKKRVEENGNVRFLRHRKPRVHWFTAHYLLLRTWGDRHRELCSSRLSGLSLGAFIKSNPFTRIARLFYRPWFVLAKPYVVCSTIGYHSNSWASFW